MKTYDFPVALQKISTEEGIAIPKRFAVIREEGKLVPSRVLGIVSNKYALLPHKDVVDGFRQALKGHDTTERIDVTKGGARLYLKIVLNDVKVKIDKGDEVALMLIVENSYDASKSLQVMFGAFRFVCSNGMVIGQKFVSLTQKHVGAASGLKIEFIQEQIAAITESFKKTAPIMSKMKMTQLELATGDILSSDFFNAEELRIPEYLAKIAAKDYTEKKGSSVWDAYNALTAAITHSMKKKSPRSSINYGRRVWDAAVSLVK